MLSILVWSNANSGFLLVLLTTVYSITTIAMFMAMQRANRIGSENIDISRKLNISMFRPYLSISLRFAATDKTTHSLPYAYVVLRNNGQTQALSVQANIEPKLQTTKIIGGVKKKKGPYFFDHEIFGLAPHDEISDAIGFTPELFENYTKPIFKGTLKYKDALGNEYFEEFEINFEISSEANIRSWQQ